MLPKRSHSTGSCVTHVRRADRLDTTLHSQVLLELVCISRQVWN